MADNLITDVQFVHSSQLEDRKNNRYCTVVKEKILTINTDTDEIVDTKDNLRFYDDIKKTVYITKPQFRTHKYKKFHEDKNKCDSYVIQESEMVPKLISLLGDKDLEKEYFTRKYVSLKKILNSPYVYNADVGSESLIRKKYIRDKKSNKVVYTYGGLDIETSVVGCERVICNAVAVEGNVYQTVLDDFMWNVDPITGEKTKANAKEVEDLAYELFGDILDKYNLKLNIRSCTDEKDVITKPIMKLNQLRTDFMGIWNIAYDIPYITKRCNVLGIDHQSLFNGPHVPNKYNYTYFKQDKAKKASVADKWHWFTSMGDVQYYDAMLLYARKRATDAKKDSYKLNAIATDELGFGKLKVSSESHYEMQTKHFVEYCAYNILDAVLIYILEQKNKDILGLLKLTDTSSLKDFAYQTIKLKDRYSKYCLDTGKVFATCGTRMEGPYDHTFGKSGGAVLKARNVIHVGLKCLFERPTLESMILLLCGDIDFEAMYPNFITAFALSKENKLFTITDIEGHPQNHIEIYCGYIGDVDENASIIGNMFYGLPTYAEMDTLFVDQLIPSNKDN